MELSLDQKRSKLRVSVSPAAAKPVSLTAAAKLMRLPVSALRDLIVFLPEPIKVTKSGKPRYDPDTLWIYWCKLGFSEMEAKDILAGRADESSII
jgi:hypothetical protein